jgi:hypothetical protein
MKKIYSLWVWLRKLVLAQHNYRGLSWLEKGAAGQYVPAGKSVINMI